MKKEEKLSHIFIIVNNSIEKSDICAFCTNVNKSEPEIRFTYQYYDTNVNEDLYNLFINCDEPKEELLIISDSQEIADMSVSEGIACVGLYSSNNRHSVITGVLYCIEDLQYMDFDRVYKMWQRFHKIPWTITNTERLIIREQTTEDIDALYEIYSDPEISRYTENLYPDRDEEYQYMVDYINNQYKYHEYGIWALVEKETGNLVGRAGLSLRPGCEDLELGFVIGKKYQRKGYAYESCKAIIEYAFENLYSDRIIAYTQVQNISSKNLLKKLGFMGNTYNEMCAFSLTKQ